MKLKLILILGIILVFVASFFTSARESKAGVPKHNQ